jgi:hypothetical protein
MQYNKNMTACEIESQLERIQKEYFVSESEARDMFINMRMDV